jgi:hypothetical protein
LQTQLHNKWTGQFFTPYHLCEAMAKMTLGDKASMESLIADKGFLTLPEPCCGSGAMVIAAANVMKAKGVNYQQNLHVKAIDIDAKCVHMAYLQFSLPSHPRRCRPRQHTFGRNVGQMVHPDAHSWFLGFKAPAA